VILDSPDPGRGEELTYLGGTLVSVYTFELHPVIAKEHWDVSLYTLKCGDT